MRCSPSRRISSFARARASARRCARVFGGSEDGGFDVVRDSCRAWASNRANRSSSPAICLSYPAVNSSKNATHENPSLDGSGWALGHLMRCRREGMSSNTLS